MPSVDAKRALWSAGVFILPVITVKLAAMILGGPAPSAAQSTAGDTSITLPVRKATAIKLTDKQLAAASHIAAHADQPFGPNPLLYLNDSSPVQAEPLPEPIVEDIAMPEPEVVFTLNAVMSGSRGKTALIDGRPYREGDRLRGSEWRVNSINTSARSVELFNPATQHHRTITVELPMSSSAN